MAKKKNVVAEQNLGSASSKGLKDLAVKSVQTLMRKLFSFVWNVFKVVVKQILGSTYSKKFFSFVWKAFAALAMCATIWIAFNPHVYVYPTINLDPTNPVFTPFVVRNEGYLAIRDVKFACSIKYIKYPGPRGTQIIGSEDYENKIYDPKQVSRVILPGEEASELLPLSGMKHNQFEKADIAVRLSFRPFRFWPFSLYEREELHRFELKTGKNGHRHWFPQPINK